MPSPCTLNRPCDRSHFFFHVCDYARPSIGPSERRRVTSDPSPCPSISIALHSSALLLLTSISAGLSISCTYAVTCQTIQKKALELAETLSRDHQLHRHKQATGTWQVLLLCLALLIHFFPFAILHFYARDTENTECLCLTASRVSSKSLQDLILQCTSFRLCHACMHYCSRISHTLRAMCLPHASRFVQKSLHPQHWDEKATSRKRNVVFVCCACMLIALPPRILPSNSPRLSFAVS